MHNTYSIWTCLLVLVLALMPSATPVAQSPPKAKVVVDDFEADTAGKVPGRWTYISKRGDVVELNQIMSENERFYVVKEGANKFLRGFTHDEAQRITRTGDDIGWDLREHARLSWEWRALQLPADANEKTKNDTGAALYVTFDTDWLGRPKSIKYTYSSTLPVGTVHSFGRLKVIVASSGLDGLGAWKKIERDVVADYRRVFGGDPPDKPLSITLWSDSDDTNGVAEVDFDNIMLRR